jgi:hypothetical protein
MKDWLDENPNGSKDAFEKYYKALDTDIKKVCDASFPTLLILI